MDKRKNTRFIPSQRIKGSDKELFIINYEGSVIEVQRTSNLYEPLIVRLNGELLETVPSKQNKEIEFSTADGKHKLQVWNERVENTLIPKIFVKDGIALVIDGVPVQNSLADPMSRLSSGKAVIWLLTILLFLKAFLIPLSFIQAFKDTHNLVILFVYIILFILSLSAALTFQLNPLRSTWIALAICIIELVEFIYSIMLTRDFSILTFLFLGLRIGILSWLIFSIRNLKHILNFDKDIIPLSKPADIPEEKRTKKKFSFKLKYVAISFIAIAIIAGIYYGVSEIITASKTPSLERDSSLEFRTDLKLPELIPYRKGNKWGCCDKNKKIIIEPKYSKVEFFDLNKFFLKVEKDGLEGIINAKGEEIIPCIYKSIDELTKEPVIIKWELYQYLKEINWYEVPSDFKTFTDSLNNKSLFCEKCRIIVDRSFALGKYKMEPDEYRYIFLSESLKNKFRVRNVKDEEFIIDDNNDILTQSEIEKFEQQKEQETFYAFRVNLQSNLKVVSKVEQNIYNYFTSRFEPHTFLGIQDKNGNVVLPTDYEIIEPAGRGTDYNIIKKITNYLEYETKMGIINSKAEIIIPCEYDEIIYGYYGGFNEKYIIVKNNGLYGLRDFENNTIMPTSYESIYFQKHGSEYYFAVKDKRKNKFGLLKEFNWYGNEEVIIPFEYDWILVDEDNNNWIRIKNRNRYGVVDFKNNIIVPAKYIGGLRLSDGLAATQYVEPDSIVKVINSNLIKNVYNLEEVHWGLLAGSEDYYLSGRTIYINPDYRYIRYTTLELANALSDTSERKKYYVQNANYLRTFSNYEEFCLNIMLSYDEELPGKWGYFNDKGDLVIDFIYDEAEDFEDGYAKVKYNNRWGFINKKGQVVIPIWYRDDYYSLSKVDGYDLFEIHSKDDKTIGFIDVNGVEYFEGEN